MSVYKQINELEVGEEATQVFFIEAIESRLTKTNKPFARLTLKDQSGKITTNIWDFDPDEEEGFVSGIYARMTIRIEEYKNFRQAKSLDMPMVLAPPDDLTVYIEKPYEF